MAPGLKALKEGTLASSFGGWISEDGYQTCFPGGSDGKESACNAGNLGSIPGWGRFPGEGNGYPLQYSCLENSMDKEASQATVHGVTKSQTQLNNYTTTTQNIEIEP